MNCFLEHTEPVRVIIQSKPNVSEVSAIRDALTLAVTEWVNVTLVHDGDEIEVFVNEVFATAKLKKALNRCKSPQ